MTDELSRAISSGDAILTASMIANGRHDVNARIATVLAFTTPLISAVQLGHTAVVQLLLDAGARVNDCDSYGQTPCHYAVSFGHLDIVERLLAHGASVSVGGRTGQTAFFAATIPREDRIVIAMIKAGVAPLDATDALCRAAGMSVTVVELLAKCGVNIAALRTNDGGTACHIAAKRGDDVDVFEHLINVAKVNIFAKDLVSGFTCTFLCAKLGRHKALRFLIDAGANLDATDDHGASALVAASTATNVDCVTLLLAAGVNVDAKDRIGRTACHFLLAGMTANRAVPARKTLVALLAAGADLDTLDDSGMTPRHFAVRVGALAVPPNDDEINAARHLIVTTSLELVRKRALQVCIGLHALELDALQMCEILIHACGRAAQVIPFHLWWRIATTVKHFH